MINALGGVFSTASCVPAQLFSDIGGFLLGPEFLGVLANLVTTFVVGLITNLLGGLLGIGM